MNDYDFIIVGGGSAGSVLANRLSAKPANRVLLLEAGRDIEPGHEPPEIRDTFYTAPYHPENLWPDTFVHWSPLPCDGTEPKPSFYEQARVIGGGSSINAMVASRGAPADFDEWVTLGAAGWAWDDVLPHYRRLETDLDFDGDLHGACGPIPIRRHRREQWPPLVQAMSAEFERLGFPHIADMNADFRDGFCSLPMSSLPTHRVSAAKGYLDASTRKRNNLTVLGGHHVERLNFKGRHVVGVSVRTPAGIRDFGTGEVIVSAGGLRSPALLLRNGIGPPETLRTLDLEVRAALPGVGANLHDHPTVFIAAHLHRDATQDAALKPNTHCALVYTSDVDACPSRDMYLTVLNKVTWHPLGRRLGGFTVCLQKPFSRGQLSLRAPDPCVPPRIQFNALADSRDMARVKAGVGKIAALLTKPGVSALLNESFGAGFSERVQRLNRHTKANWLLSAGASVALDGPAPLRRWLLDNVLRIGPALPELLTDEVAMDAWVRGAVTGFFHPSGTCRMGQPGDPSTVVDSEGRVQGVAGLRVVDASIMPSPIRAPTNLTTMMMAEKIASGIV